MPHSSVTGKQDLRPRDCWFDPRLGQYSFSGIDDSLCDRLHSSVTAVHSFGNGMHVQKKLVAPKENCAGHWLKELQKSIDWCTGHRDITEILLKKALNTIKIIHSISFEKIRVYNMTAQCEDGPR